jgi:hypothetical protein
MTVISEITKTVDRYYAALYRCDCGEIKQVFAPSASIQGYYEGELIHQGLPSYLKLLASLSSPEMIGEEVNERIISIDIEGNAAVVKVQYVFESLEYIDYLSYLKIDYQWKIVQKLFHHKSKSKLT